MIFAGFSFFTYHASYRNMSKFLKNLAVLPMITYPVLYSFFNIFFEDLKRYFLIGDAFCKMTSIFSFVFCIAFSFWHELKFGAESMELNYTILILASIYTTCLLIKYLKEWSIGRYYYISWWYINIMVLSLFVGLYFQENSNITPFSLY
jgi:hypothetical protein